MLANKKIHNPLCNTFTVIFCKTHGGAQYFLFIFIEVTCSVMNMNKGYSIKGFLSNLN